MSMPDISQKENTAERERELQRCFMFLYKKTVPL